MNIVLAVLIGYVIGSLPFSFMVGKYWGKVDLRTVGSGNLGATNVVRTLGWRKGLVAFALDLFKGVAAVLLVEQLFGFPLACLSGAVSVLGHCYSVFLGWKGGKGVAVTFGIILAIQPLAAVILVVIHLVILFSIRKMSLASITSATALPVVVYLLNGLGAYFYMALFLGLFIIFQHRSNIQRLINGQEAPLF